MKLLPLALAPLVVVLLGGCSIVGQALYDDNEREYSDAADLLERGPLSTSEATWLPADAEDIALQYSTQKLATGAAVIGFTSASDLVDCIAAEEVTLPPFVAVWGPDKDEIEGGTAAQYCGDWTFVPFDDGWFGWTTSAPPMNRGA